MKLHFTPFPQFSAHFLQIFNFVEAHVSRQSWQLAFYSQPPSSYWKDTFYAKSQIQLKLDFIEPENMLKYLCIRLRSLEWTQNENTNRFRMNLHWIDWYITLMLWFLDHFFHFLCWLLSVIGHFVHHNFYKQCAICNFHNIEIELTVTAWTTPFTITLAQIQHIHFT